jgi:hypothetical protein
MTVSRVVGLCFAALMALATGTARAQTGVVTGKITDESGVGIPTPR